MTVFVTYVHHTLPLLGSMSAGLCWRCGSSQGYILKGFYFACFTSILLKPNDAQPSSIAAAVIAESIEVYSFAHESGVVLAPKLSDTVLKVITKTLHKK